MDTVPARLPQRPVQRSGIQSVGRRLLSLPMFCKVLIANSAIVVGGAVLGTAITAARVGSSSGASIVQLMGIFVAVGIVVSLLVNAMVLRAAFAPLRRIERTIQAIRAGRT